MNNDTENNNFIYYNYMTELFTNNDNLSELQKETLRYAINQLCNDILQGNTCIDLLHYEIDIEILKAIKVVRYIEKENNHEIQPFIINNHDFYFNRHWDYEKNIINYLVHIFKSPENKISKNIKHSLNLYFNNNEEIDYQKLAVENSLKNQFSIITGGPGTGKTTTALKLLALLKEQNPDFEIALSTPTGKAAARLKESIEKGKEKLINDFNDKKDNIKLIPSNVQTIHKMLGSNYQSSYFKYNNSNNLSADIVIIDEASMVSLPLFSKILSALKPSAKLILLGDKDQLVSVEMGAVFNDIITTFPKSFSKLEKSYRFEGDIKELAEAINSQNEDEALNILKKETCLKVTLNNHDKEIKQEILNKFNKYINFAIQNKDNVIGVFKKYNEFQVLCSNKDDEFGVNDINEYIEKNITKSSANGNWYIGRPIMISKNISNGDIVLNNGDTGIYLGDNLVYFEDNESIESKFKKYNPFKIGDFKIAYAITVHKSQGSEYKDIYVSLPKKFNEIMTKELLYTAITRAKETVKIISSEKTFKDMINHSSQRYSGFYNYKE